jgi:hypothetical protein
MEGRSDGLWADAWKKAKREMTMENKQSRMVPPLERVLLPGSPNV